eukprot:47928-Rhodomonas_salina.1
MVASSATRRLCATAPTASSKVAPPPRPPASGAVRFRNLSVRRSVRSGSESVSACCLSHGATSCSLRTPSSTMSCRRKVSSAPARVRAVSWAALPPASSWTAFQIPVSASTLPRASPASKACSTLWARALFSCGVMLWLSSHCAASAGVCTPEKAMSCTRKASCAPARRAALSSVAFAPRTSCTALESTDAAWTFRLA